MGVHRRAQKGPVAAVQNQRVEPAVAAVDRGDHSRLCDNERIIVVGGALKVLEARKTHRDRAAGPGIDEIAFARSGDGERRIRRRPRQHIAAAAADQLLDVGEGDVREAARLTASGRVDLPGLGAPVVIDLQRVGPAASRERYGGQRQAAERIHIDMYAVGGRALGVADDVDLLDERQIAERQHGVILCLVNDLHPLNVFRDVADLLGLGHHLDDQVMVLVRRGQLPQIDREHVRAQQQARLERVKQEPGFTGLGFAMAERGCSISAMIFA